MKSCLSKFFRFNCGTLLLASCLVGAGPALANDHSFTSTEKKIHATLFAQSQAATATSEALEKVSIRTLPSKQGINIQEWTYPSGKLKVKGKLYTAAKTTTPQSLIIFNHDGISGISKYHELSSLRLASKGFAVFSPSYRGEDGSEGQIEIAKGEVDDVINVLPLLRSVVKTDSVYLMGASHGALISLLAASRLAPGEIKGVIFAYGVADIYSWWDYLKKAGKLGKDPITRRTYGDGPQARPQSFSIRHGLTAAEKLQVPILILQGGQDDITPPQQGRILAQTLKKRGANYQYKEYPNCLHGFLVYAPYLKNGVTQAERRETECAWQDVFTFLAEHD